MGGVSRRGFTPVLNFGLGVMTATMLELQVERKCDDDAKVLLATTGVTEVSDECVDDELSDLHFGLAFIRFALGFTSKSFVHVVADNIAGG